MTLPYDIARCAGMSICGDLAHQCADCARQIYSKPSDCHPHYQPWVTPHHAAHDEACPNYIAPQPTKTTP